MVRRPQESARSIDSIGNEREKFCYWPEHVSASNTRLTRGNHKGMKSSYLLLYDSVQEPIPIGVVDFAWIIGSPLSKRLFNLRVPALARTSLTS